MLDSYYLGSDSMPSEQLEEYLKTIYDIAGKDGVARTTSIAKCLKLSPASVTEAMKNLAEKGLVIYEPYKGVTLTEEGLTIAAKIKRKHRLLEVFLTNFLNIDKEAAHAEACKLEHDISDETESALCKMLDAPARCPHGSHISSCSMVVGTCDECKGAKGAKERKENNRKVVPITDLEPCEKGIIKFLRGNQKIVQRLSDLGLTLHTEIELLRKTPMNGPIEVCIRRTNLAIAREIADNIFVNIAE
jgi:DtxR family transcriptional regulator, Mn-dependent transcriptional regulator